MRLIDADALPRHGQRGGLVHWKDIENAPTIPAVVPVRCHECVHDGHCEAQVFIGYSGMCYCSSGKRKEGQ